MHIYYTFHIYFSLEVYTAGLSKMNGSLLGGLEVLFWGRGKGSLFSERT